MRETYYSLFTSGSTAASANTAHLLFGSYQGLSVLNNDDVVHIRLEATGGDARVAGATVSNNIGISVYVAASGYNLPAMRAGTASQLYFANRLLGANATVSWNIFRRVP